jgi:hypothetical protein
MAKSQYTKDDLIAHIINLRLVENWSTKSLLDLLQNTLKYSKTQSYEYIKWAREEIKERYKATNDAMVEEAIYQYEEMLELAKHRKDIKVWNDLRKELNKITGIYTAEKVDITSGGKEITEIKLIQIKSKDDLENGGTND